MSAPFAGTPSLPFSTAIDLAPLATEDQTDLHDELAKLPRPRKHYQRYYTTREANDDMRYAPQGIHSFLRAYYHYKSADWANNKPFRLKARTAEEMAQMPTYYIMDLHKGMAETVASAMPSTTEIATNQWLPNDQLKVYSEEFGRTGFQGGLQYYRAGELGRAEMELFAGRAIDQPSMFIAGESDWGSYQNPGVLERMQEHVCKDMRGGHMVKGAGHWVQQEQPKETSNLLLEFLSNL